VITLSPEQKVMVGTTLLGAVAGLVGCFAVLRRRALVGDMLAHAALPGLCVAFLVAAALEPVIQQQMGANVELKRNFLVLLTGAFCSGLLGIGLVTLVCRWTRTKEDAAIGIVLSTFFGAGVVLLSVIRRMPVGGKSGLDSYLFGQAAGIRYQDLVVIAVVSLFSLAVLSALYKEFKVLSFDPEFARTQGWPITLLDLIMMGTLTVVTIVGLPAVGVVLMAALIIMPGAAARFWTDRLGSMLLLSTALGAATGLLGTVASARTAKNWLGIDPFAFLTGGASLPTGPVIVLVGTAIFLFSVVFAPRRGVLSRLIVEFRLRRKTAHENLLRSLYELCESQLPERPAVAIDMIRAHRSWSPGVVGRLIRQASRRHLLAYQNETVRLTPEGLARAAQITHNHRLWERFLIEGAGIAADHVDRDADLIEHVLTPEIIQRLEDQLGGTAGPPRQIYDLPSSVATPDDSASHIDLPSSDLPEDQDG